MGLLDGNPAIDVADLHQSAETGQSFLDSAGDAITKGVPLAVASGVSSMLDTAVALGNSLGGEFERINFEKNVQEYDDDLSRYYKEHKEGIDLAGFIGTSFIPGTAGLKALKFVQAGGAGRSTAAVTSLFKSAEERYLQKALSSVQAETNSVFSKLNGDKIAAIAAGYGEQALQAAAFETAVLVTSNQNPTMNKEDTGYFQTLLYSSPEVFKGAILGGFIGGSINAFGLSGQLKSAIRARDKSDFTSLNIKELGYNDIDPGSEAAFDFYMLKAREKHIELSRTSGEANAQQLQNYERTQVQKADELRYRLKDDLAGGDAELGNAIYSHISRPVKDQTTPAEDVALSLLGAATKAERITFEDMLEKQTEKILFKEGTLSPRHAENILKRGKIAPAAIEPADGPALEEAKMAGYELYKDSAGNMRVIPGVSYEKELAKKIDKTKHAFIVKLAGDDAGRITETAYPVAGDLGDVSYKKGELFINDVLQKAKPYDPAENGYFDSHLAFLRENLDIQASKKLKKAAGQETEEGAEGGGEIEFTNLPRLERAVKEESGAYVTDAHGEVMGEADMATLKNAKLYMRQEMVNLGHDFDQIALELNVSREFAETGSGKYLLDDDFTKPMHVKMSYDTKSYNLDKNSLRGYSDLMTRVAIAKDHNHKVAAEILGDAYFLLPKTSGTMLGINTMPELGNFIKSADETYGSFGQLMQQAGKVADEQFRTRFNKAYAEISAFDQKIRMDAEKTAQFNLLVAKVRSAQEPLSLQPGGFVVPKSVIEELKENSKSVQPDSPEFQQMYANAIKSAVDRKIGFKIEDEDILGYFQSTQGINSERVTHFNNVFAAKGSSTKWDGTSLYLPPIDTRKYPFVAFVREKAETEFRPVSVVTASDATSLEAKIRTIKAQHGDQLIISTKDNLKTYYQLRGEYESGLLLGDSTVDNSLKKMGVLSDFQPRTDAAVLDDFLNWHFQQEQSLVRNSVELHYAQEFAELRAMGKNFNDYQTSKFQRELSDKELSQIHKDNPYEKYISTGLAISNQTKYDSVWGRLNSGVEALGQSMFRVWDSIFNKANKGELAWEAGNKQAEQLGFRPPFSDVLKEVLNPVIADRKVVEPIVAKVNAALATTVLRLDPLNAIVNILGTPGLMAAELKSIFRNIKNPDIVGNLSNMLSADIPGTAFKLPSTTELISKALTNFVTDNGEKLAFYQRIGAVQDDLKLYKTVLDASQLTKAHMSTAGSIIAWANDVVAKTAEVGSKLTGNNLSERMVRFVAADIMYQLGTAAKLGSDEIAAYINTFVNRVHGNYVASQRPHLFQGAVGQAVSLFQTYQFNVIQNMMRFVENNEKTSIAALLGMQNTLFGLQGNPAFYLLNSYIGNTNREHKDMVTGMHAVVGEDVGKWLTYGLGANALKVNLYNRGDLTPRYVTVVPTTLTDVPAVSIPAKFIGSVLNTIQSINQGAPISTAILEGVSHNGVNRPLAGIAQLAQGYRTTTKGNMLVAYNDIDTMLVAAKVLGGEELNRAVAIDAFYRQQAYKVKDRENINNVGEAFKQKVRSGEPMTNEDMLGFMTEYSRSGGRTDTFNRFVTGQQKNANRSQISVMKDALGTTYAKNLGTIMGAEDDEFLYRTPDVGTGGVAQ